MIEGTDGYWYIYNPQPTDDTRTYLKLRREGNKLIADLPQIIMREEQEDENGETYYRDFNAMLFDRSDNPDEKYVAKKAVSLNISYRKTVPFRSTCQYRTSSKALQTAPRNFKIPEQSGDLQVGISAGD